MQWVTLTEAPGRYDGDGGRRAAAASIPSGPPAWPSSWPGGGGAPTARTPSPSPRREPSTSRRWTPSPGASPGMPIRSPADIARSCGSPMDLLSPNTSLRSAGPDTSIGPLAIYDRRTTSQWRGDVQLGGSVAYRRRRGLPTSSRRRLAGEFRSGDQGNAPVSDDVVHRVAALLKDFRRRYPDALPVITGLAEQTTASWAKWCWIPMAAAASHVSDRGGAPDEIARGSPGLAGSARGL
jgi:hypothetical protein